MRTRFASFLALAVPFLMLPAACGGSAGGGTGGGTSTSTSTSTNTTSTTTSGGGSGGAGGAAPINKAAACASTFGQALTASFGRLDGTVLAVVRPVDTQCPLPNNDHVILQVTMNGEAYRMVINIESSFGDPDVRYLALDHALPGPAWSEGWHTGIGLDYVVDFGVHTGQFTPHPLAELADIVTDAIPLGKKVSVYADSSGGSSAHKVHRNGSNLDGAIVIEPDGPAPKVLLFHFANQSF